MSRYVFDSHALIAYFREEPGADRVEALVTDPGHERWLSVISLGEVYYIAAKRTDMREDEVLSDVLSMPLALVDASMMLVLEAAQVKAKYPLSYADCFAVAVAQRYDAAIVTGDPEFEQLEANGEVQIEWLPPKPKKRSR